MCNLGGSPSLHLLSRLDQLLLQVLERLLERLVLLLRCRGRLLQFGASSLCHIGVVEATAELADLALGGLQLGSGIATSLRQNNFLGQTDLGLISLLKFPYIVMYE